MNTPPESPPLVTVPLPLLVKGLLGDGYWDSRIIDPDMAELILLHTKNQTQHCFIELPDESVGIELQGPRLWYWHKWRASCDAHARAQAYSEKEMDEYIVFNHNVNMVARKLMEFAGLDEKRAKASAYGWVKKQSEKIKQIGVKKMATKREDT